MRGFALAYPLSRGGMSKEAKRKQPEKQYGYICGGVVKQSLFEEEPMGYMMAFILPDQHYDSYVKLKQAGKNKEAEAIVDKHAWSAI